MLSFMNSDLLVFVSLFTEATTVWCDFWE